MQKYSAEEKKKILEDFLLSQASGEPIESVCARVGVSRTLIYYWKGILDRGGDLEDIMAEPDPPPPPPVEPSPPPAAEPPPQPQAVKTMTNGTGRQGIKRTDISDARKVHAVKRTLKGSATITELANELGVAWGTVDSWVQKYKAGGFGPVDEVLVNSQPKRGQAGGRPRTKSNAPPPAPEPAPKRTRAPRTEIVQFRDPPPPSTGPVQLGLALTDADQLTLLRAENLRLKAKIRQLVAMVVEDE